MSEFDAFSEGYDSGIDNSVKKLVGSNHGVFTRYKATWLSENLKKNSIKVEHILDFGCGSADLLAAMYDFSLAGSYSGCEVSEGMLNEAKQRGLEDTPIELKIYDGKALPYKDESFDVITANTVFHHIELKDRPRIYEELKRVLKPKGRLYIFEHNPYNPLTLWVVRNTPIDANAILLKPGEIESSLKKIGLSKTKIYFQMFFPPRLSFFWSLERRLSFLPMGGAYVTETIKE